MGHKKNIYHHFINSFGWKTKRRIIVFESDDWGGVRIPDLRAYNKLLESGIAVDRCNYSKFDGIEQSSDYYDLFHLLKNFKDKNGKHPIFTLNFNTANPDFCKIKEDDFQNYHYERFDKTYARHDARLLDALNEGIQSRLIHPQYHGREHLNIFMWMDMLRENNVDIKTAFDLNCFALGFLNSPSIKLPYLAAYAPYKNIETKNYIEIILSGIELFNEVFGFEPKTFIPPVYMHSNELIEKLNGSSIIGLQGLATQRDPINNSLNFRFLKTNNIYNHVQLIRNCFFEPSTDAIRDWVKETISEIEIAFGHHKPAIICTHRLNYMGGLVPNNKEKNHQTLYTLLLTILRKWNNIEFLSSSELAEDIKESIQ